MRTARCSTAPNPNPNPNSNPNPNPNPNQVLDGHWGPDGHAIALTDLGGRLSLYSLGLGAAAPPVQVGPED